MGSSKRKSGHSEYFQQTFCSNDQNPKNRIKQHQALQCLQNQCYVEVENIDYLLQGRNTISLCELPEWYYIDESFNFEYNNASDNQLVNLNKVRYNDNSQCKTSTKKKPKGFAEKFDGSEIIKIVDTFSLASSPAVLNTISKKKKRSNFHKASLCELSANNCIEAQPLQQVSNHSDEYICTEKISLKTFSTLKAKFIHSSSLQQDHSHSSTNDMKNVFLSSALDDLLATETKKLEANVDLSVKTKVNCSDIVYNTPSSQSNYVKTLKTALLERQKSSIKDPVDRKIVNQFKASQTSFNDFSSIIKHPISSVAGLSKPLSLYPNLCLKSSEFASKLTSKLNGNFLQDLSLKSVKFALSSFQCASQLVYDNKPNEVIISENRRDTAFAIKKRLSKVATIENNQNVIKTGGLDVSKNTSDLFEFQDSEYFTPEVIPFKYKTIEKSNICSLLIAITSSFAESAVSALKFDHNKVTKKNITLSKPTKRLTKNKVKKKNCKKLSSLKPISLNQAFGKYLLYQANKYRLEKICRDYKSFCFAKLPICLTKSKDDSTHMHLYLTKQKFCWNEVKSDNGTVIFPESYSTPDTTILYNLNNSNKVSKNLTCARVRAVDISSLSQNNSRKRTYQKMKTMYPTVSSTLSDDHKQAMQNLDGGVMVVQLANSKYKNSDMIVKIMSFCEWGENAEEVMNIIIENHFDLQTMQRGRYIRTVTQGFLIEVLRVSSYQVEVNNMPEDLKKHLSDCNSQSISLVKISPNPTESPSDFTEPEKLIDFSAAIDSLLLLDKALARRSSNGFCTTKYLMLKHTDIENCKKARFDTNADAVHFTQEGGMKQDCTLHSLRHLLKKYVSNKSSSSSTIDNKNLHPLRCAVGTIGCLKKVPSNSNLNVAKTNSMTSSSLLNITAENANPVCYSIANSADILNRKNLSTKKNENPNSFPTKHTLTSLKRKLSSVESLLERTSSFESSLSVSTIASTNSQIDVSTTTILNSCIAVSNPIFSNSGKYCNLNKKGSLNNLELAKVCSLTGNSIVTTTPFISSTSTSSLQAKRNNAKSSPSTNSKVLSSPNTFQPCKFSKLASTYDYFSLPNNQSSMVLPVSNNSKSYPLAIPFVYHNVEAAASTLNQKNMSEFRNTNNQRFQSKQEVATHSKTYLAIPLKVFGSNENQVNSCSKPNFSSPNCIKYVPNCIKIHSDSKTSSSSCPAPPFPPSVNFGNPGPIKVLSVNNVSPALLTSGKEMLAKTKTLHGAHTVTRISQLKPPIIFKKFNNNKSPAFYKLNSSMGNISNSFASTDTSLSYPSNNSCKESAKIYKSGISTTVSSSVCEILDKSTNCTSSSNKAITVNLTKSLSLDNSSNVGYKSKAVPASSYNVTKSSMKPVISNCSTFNYSFLSSISNSSLLKKDTDTKIQSCDVPAVTQIYSGFNGDSDWNRFKEILVTKDEQLLYKTLINDKKLTCSLWSLPPAIVFSLITSSCQYYWKNHPPLQEPVKLKLLQEKFLDLLVESKSSFFSNSQGHDSTSQIKGNDNINIPELLINDQNTLSQEKPTDLQKNSPSKKIEDEGMYSDVTNCSKDSILDLDEEEISCEVCSKSPQSTRIMKVDEKTSNELIGSDSAFGQRRKLIAEQERRAALRARTDELRSVLNFTKEKMVVSLSSILKQARLEVKYLKFEKKNLKSLKAMLKSINYKLHFYLEILQENSSIDLVEQVEVENIRKQIEMDKKSTVELRKTHQIKSFSMLNIDDIEKISLLPESCSLIPIKHCPQSECDEQQTRPESQLI